MPVQYQKDYKKMMDEKNWQETDYIADLILSEKFLIARTPEVEHERRVAIFDVLEKNRFKVIQSIKGPYKLVISLSGERLIFNISDKEGLHLDDIQLSLTIFFRLVKNYFIICKNYYQAIKIDSPDRIETLDRVRRNLHDEGAKLLHKKLAYKVDMDMRTARNLFTLICVLQMRG